MTSYLKQHSGVLKTEGILMLVLGFLGILLPQIFTFGIELLIGVLLLVGGILAVVRGFRLRGVPGTALSITVGVLSILVGIALLAFPMSGAITLTLLVGILFLIQGAAEVAAALQHREWTAWGWMLASGIASLLIALFLIVGLPGIAAWAIGMLVGINLIFTGSWLLMLGSAVNSQLNGGPEDGP